MPVKITELITYPIKSCAGIKHEKIAINAMGLQGDRQMMIIQNDGLFMSQRQHPKMALIQPEITSSTTLKLSAPNMPDIEVDYKKDLEVQLVTVWKDTFNATTLHPDIDTWLSDYFGLSVKLVKYASSSCRLIDTDYAKNKEQVAFADGYPVLVTHQETLKHLNKHLSQSVPMSRFRPNIVVESDRVSWDELYWKHIYAKDVTIQLPKPCARCIMTGIDQKTGEQTGTEVFTTLAKKLPQNGKAIFGMNGIPILKDSTTAELQIGQSIQVE